MPSAPVGSFVYVNFFQLIDVEAYITIKRSVDEKDEDVTCVVKNGDTILY